MIKFSRNDIPDSLVKDKVCVEVGVDQGEFSKILLSKNPKKIYLVDAWKTIEGTDRTTGAEQSIHDEKYQKVCKMFERDHRVEIIRAWSEDAAAMFEDKSVDWVYVDGRHDYVGVMSDLNAWEKKIKPTGFLWGDDYRTPDMKHKPRVEVRQAVADFTNDSEWNLVGLTMEERRSKSFFLAKNKEVTDKFKSF